MAASKQPVLWTSNKYCGVLLVYFWCLARFGILAADGVIGSGQDYTCDTFPDYAAYMEQWWYQGPQISSKLYPYGSTYCDLTITREQVDLALIGVDPGIDFSVPYYGKLYHSLWISPNGFVALEVAKPAKSVPFIWVETLPNPQYPTGGAQDPAMIAPFYAEADMLRSPPEPSMIAYRILDVSKAPNTNQRLIMEGLLWDISTEIRSAVVGGDNFQATHGIIVTWHKITFLGNDCTGNDACARNTYQMALMTDGTDTYSVFSYQNMTWVGGGANQNCDRLKGTTSSSHPNCQPGHAGFNAGSGRWFHALPYSNMDELATVDVAGGAGSNVTGRYYYKVSGDTVRRGGCTNDTAAAAGGRWPTEVFPNSGGMLGGTALNISGPCFNHQDRLKCRFDGNIVDATYVNNIMRVTCHAPTLASVGPIKVAVSTDGGSSFPFETEYVVVTPDHIVPDILISRQNADWLNPGQMELTWSPKQLTPRPGDRVDIRLYGYREDSSSGSPVAVWETLHTFADDYSNTGVFTFNPDGNFICDYAEEGQKCTLFDVGAFQINTEKEGQDPANPRRIWSQVFPLGWYVQDAMIQDRDNNWISYKCEVWYNANNKDTSWDNSLEPCPCTFEHAYTDFGRFQPDPSCTIESTSSTNCERHLGADHCVLSVYASTSGSGTQCCYDDNGHLMYSGDTQYGSRPQRSHVWGSHPYKTPPRVPNLSHWQWDLTGFYYCCQWQSDPQDCYESFLDQRRTASCDQYVISGQAVVFGDPHFLTFDSVFYTFNGYGEFWLMKVEQATVHGQLIQFKLHARFEQPDNQTWGATKATYMTAVGMQLNNGNKVVVELNKGGIQKKLLVYINHYLLDLTYLDLRRQEFKDFIIINNGPIGSNEATNFTIVYRCGLGVNVVYKNNLMELIVSAPPEFEGHTRGLLGKWNGDSSDDLDPQTPGGPIIGPGETENLHNNFGLTWMVTSSESCFQYLYRAKLNHDYYNKNDFVPNFVPTFPPNNTDVTDEMVNSLCGGDKACTFDYKATLNAEVAAASLDIQAWDQQRREMGQPVTSCGWLEIPYSTKSQPISYLAGSVVTITGCISGYSLEGPTEYRCQDIGEGLGLWSPEVTTICRGPDDPLPTTTILAIAIPAGLVFVLLIIGIVVAVLVCRKKKKKKRRAMAGKQAYVPVFQEIIDWKRGVEASTDPEQPQTSIQSLSKDERKQRAHSKKGLVDVMSNTGATADFSVVPPTPEKKVKPPRPELNTSHDKSLDSIDIKNHYDNKLMHSSDDSGQNSGNHVSWDTQDGDQDDKVSDSRPVQVSTLKSNKSKKISMDPSPKSSPKTKKKKRPYQYPTESRDNSQDDVPSHDSSSVHFKPQEEQLSMYKPRDIHSYTQGHNIPTSDNKASNYYQRKYGRYGAGYHP